MRSLKPRKAQRFTMGKLIHAIVGNKHDVHGICQDSNVVAGKLTRGLRLLLCARYRLVRLAERVAAGFMAVQPCCATSAMPCAIGMAEPTGSSRSERRHGWPWPGLPRRGRR